MAEDRCPLGHKDYLETLCPFCGFWVDRYGNTEEQFDYCCSPDCGCDRVAGCPNGKDRD